MTTHQLLPFLAVVAVISVTPGPDTVLVLRNTFSDGVRGGLITALGCSIGLLIWGIASAVGLATVMSASSNLFAAIRIVGGIYLTWLGVRMIWGARRVKDVTAGGQTVSQQATKQRQPFMAGLLTDLLNPKAAAFFTALLPQFVMADDHVLATTLSLAGIVSAAAFVGLLAYTMLASRARETFNRPRLRRLFDAVTGLVLVGLGIRMLAREANA
jgi:RhtB (resistance to homoserine/threonine) family protein